MPRPVLILVLVLATVALAGLVHLLTLRWAASGLLEAEARIRTLEAEVATLGRRLESAQSRESQAEQAAEVTRRANRLLREEESARQAELQRLQGELDFYRRLAGTSGTQTGLAIYHLELTPSASPRVYRFVLTLTQNLRRSAITTGTARLSVEGTLEDRPVTLPWSRVTADGAEPPAFRFKYFEQLGGYLTLPDGFTPIRVVVTLEAKGQSKPVTRGFDWQRLLDPDSTPVRPAPDSGADAPAPPEPDDASLAFHREGRREWGTH